MKKIRLLNLRNFIFKKKQILLVLCLAIFAIFYINTTPTEAQDSDQPNFVWQPVTTYMQNHNLTIGDPQLVIYLSYDPTNDIPFTFNSFTKNSQTLRGVVPDQTAASGTFTLQAMSQGKILSKKTFVVSPVISNFSPDTTQELTNSIGTFTSLAKIIAVPWDNSIDTVRIVNEKGAFITEEAIIPSTINEIPSSTDFDVGYYDVQNPILGNMTQFLNTNPGDLGYFNIVFVSQGFTPDEQLTFNTIADEARDDAFQTVEPWRTRVGKIHTTRLFTTEDFRCGWNEPIPCFLESELFSYVASRGLINTNEIWVIKKTDPNAAPGGRSRFFMHYSVVTSHYYGHVGLALVHEMGHAAEGLYDEYDRGAVPGNEESGADQNCYRNTHIPYSGWNGKVGIADYAPTCGLNTNWYKPSSQSIMNVHWQNPYYNYVSYDIMKGYLDDVVGVSSDTTAPTISITYPTEGQVVSGAFYITVDAQDMNGTVHGVVPFVQYYKDGVFWKTEYRSLNHYWDTAYEPPGPHQITVKAFDSALNQSSTSSVNVIVGTPTPTCAPNNGFCTNNSMCCSGYCETVNQYCTTPPTPTPTFHPTNTPTPTSIQPTATPAPPTPTLIACSGFCTAYECDYGYAYGQCSGGMNCCTIGPSPTPTSMPTPTPCGLQGQEAWTFCDDPTAQYNYCHVDRGIYDAQCIVQRNHTSTHCNCATPTPTPQPPLFCSQYQNLCAANCDSTCYQSGNQWCCPP